MRVTGGVYKGRKLIVPPGVIRPAMDRMRESLFAVLGDIRGCSFLDLYCGSGSVGIEAASRGAEPVVFVEKDRGRRAVLERNVGFVREQTELHILPVEHYLRRVKRSFDRIFLDPPFRQRAKLEVLQLIAARRILAEGGYEAEGAMVYYDRPTRLSPKVEDLLVATVRRLLPTGFRAHPTGRAAP